MNAKHVGTWSVLLTLAATAALADPPATPPAAPATGAATGPATRATTRRSTRPPPLPTDRPAVKRNAAGEPAPLFLKMHEGFITRGKAGPVGVLFLGDSITQWWTRAPDVWARHYGAMQPANFGIAGDRTEHVLWRLAHGELDDVRPKVVVLMIGTNNAGDTPAHVTAGTAAVAADVRRRLPDAKLLLLGIFPRGDDPAKPDVAALRGKLRQVNAALAKLDDGDHVRFLDVGDKFLAPGGLLTKDVMPDGLHPSPKGYQIWADAMQPLLDQMMGTAAAPATRPAG